MSLYAVSKEKFSHIDDLERININVHMKASAGCFDFNKSKRAVKASLKLMRKTANDILKIENDNLIVMQFNITEDNIRYQLWLLGLLKNDEGEPVYNVNDHKIKIFNDVFITLHEMKCQEKMFVTFHFEGFLIVLLNPETLLHEMIMNNVECTIHYELLMTMAKCFKLNMKQMINTIIERKEKIKGAIKLNKYDL